MKRSTNNEKEVGIEFDEDSKKCIKSLLLSVNENVSEIMKTLHQASEKSKSPKVQAQLMKKLISDFNTAYTKATTNEKITEFSNQVSDIITIIVKLVLTQGVGFAGNRCQSAISTMFNSLSKETFFMDCFTSIFSEHISSFIHEMNSKISLENGTSLLSLSSYFRILECVCEIQACSTLLGAKTVQIQNIYSTVLEKLTEYALSTSASLFNSNESVIIFKSAASVIQKLSTKLPQEIISESLAYYHPSTLRLIKAFLNALPLIRASKPCLNASGICIANLTAQGILSYSKEEEKSIITEKIMKIFFSSYLPQSDVQNSPEHKRQKISSENDSSLYSLANSLPNICRYSIFRGLCLSKESIEALTTKITFSHEGQNHIGIPLLEAVFTFLMSNSKQNENTFEFSVLLQTLYSVLDLLNDKINSFTDIENFSSFFCISRETFHSRVIDSTMAMIWNHWDSSIAAIQLWVKDCFNITINLHKSISNCSSDEDQFFIDILFKALKISWKNKGKYGIIKSLLDNVSLSLIFKLSPKFLSNLVDCLCDHIVKTPASQLFSKIIILIGNKKDKDINTIKQLVLPPIVSSLLQHSQENGFLAVAKFCIVPLLKQLPYILPYLIQEIVGSCSKTDLLNPKQLIVLLVVLTNARQLGIIDEDSFSSGEIKLLSNENPNSILDSNSFSLKNILISCLEHTDEFLVSTALELLCIGQRPAEPPSKFELDCVKQYISAAFAHNTKCSRQQNINLLSKFLQRVRAARTAAHLALRKDRDEKLKQNKDNEMEVEKSQKAKKSRKQERKILYRNQQSELGKLIISGTGLHANSIELQNFVDWFGDICCASFHPTASEERTTFAIASFASLLNIFPYNPQTKDLGLYSISHFESLFIPLAASTGKTRSTAYQCLMSFPSIYELEGNNSSSFAKRYISRAFQLCLSPRMSEAEAGSSMISILVNKLIFDLQNSDLETKGSAFIPKFSFDSFNISIDISEVKMLPLLAIYSLWYEQIILLLQFCSNHSMISKDNSGSLNEKFLDTLSVSSKYYPLHGVISALRVIIELSSPLLNLLSDAVSKSGNYSYDIKDLFKTWRKNIRTSINLCRTCSSIAIAPVSTAAPEGYTDKQQMDEDFEENIVESNEPEKSDNIPDNAISFNSNSNGQMIRSFCWLAVKEISLLIGTMIYSLPLPPLVYYLDPTAPNESDEISDDSTLNLNNPISSISHDNFKPWHLYANNALFTLEQLALSEDILIALLLASRHKGAIEMAYEGLLLFCKGILIYLKKCSLSSFSKSDNGIEIRLPLDALPKALVACTLSHAKKIASKSSSAYSSGALFARRSAGTPLALCAVLAAEAQSTTKGTVWVDINKDQVNGQKISGNENDSHFLLNCAMEFLIDLCSENHKQTKYSIDLEQFSCFSFEKSMERVLPLSLFGELNSKKSTNITSDSFLDLDPKVHAIHTMNAMLRNKTVADTLDPYLSRIFITVFDGLSSSLWAVRSAATLCFYAVVRKSANNKTFKHFFAQQPLLLPVLLEKLKRFADMKQNSETDILQSSLFACLTLFATLQPPHPLDEENENKTDNDESNEQESSLSKSPTLFISSIVKIATTQPFAKVREMASNAIGPLLLSQNIDKAFELVLSLYSDSKTYNQLHGTLLLLRSLFVHNVLSSTQQPLNQFQRGLNVIQRIGESLSQFIDPAQRPNKHAFPPTISACASRLVEGILLALRSGQNISEDHFNAQKELINNFLSKVVFYSIQGLFLNEDDFKTQTKQNEFFETSLKQDLHVSPVQLCVHLKQCSRLILYLSIMKQWQDYVSPLLGHPLEDFINLLITHPSVDVRQQAAKFCSDISVLFASNESHDPLLSNSLLPSIDSASFAFSDKDKVKKLLRFENLDSSEFILNNIHWDKLQKYVLLHLSKENDQKTLVRLFTFLTRVSSFLPPINFNAIEDKVSILQLLEKFLQKQGWSSSNALEVFSLVLSGKVLKSFDINVLLPFSNLFIEILKEWSLSNSPMPQRFASIRSINIYLLQNSDSSINRVDLLPLISRMLRDDDLDVRCFATQTLSTYCKKETILSPLISLTNSFSLILKEKTLAYSFIKDSLFEFDSKDYLEFFSKPYFTSCPQYLFVIEPDNFYEEPISYFKLCLQQILTQPEDAKVNNAKDTLRGLLLENSSLLNKPRITVLCEILQKAIKWLQNYNTLASEKPLVHSQWGAWLSSEPAVFRRLSQLFVAFQAACILSESDLSPYKTEIQEVKSQLNQLTAHYHLCPILSELCNPHSTFPSLERFLF